MDIKTMLGDKFKENLSKEEMMELLAEVDVVSQTDFDKKISEMGNENRQKAEEKLKKDTKFLDTLKKQVLSEIEEDAKLDAEQKAEKLLKQAEDKLRQASIVSNKAVAKDLLANANIPKDQYSFALDFLVTDKEDTTTQKVTDFITNFNNAVDSKLSIEKEKLKKQVDDNEETGETKARENFDYSNASYEDAIKQYQNENK